MGKRLLAVLLGGALIVATAGAGSILWLRAAVDAPEPLPPEGALVHIAPGSSLRQAATLLEESGVVASRWTLLALARWEEAERGLRAGEFHFRGSPSPREVLARLRSNGIAERRVTIPEGRTALEVFELLEEAGLGGADAFAGIAADPEWLLRMDLPATGVEGYLFPDTYGFTPDLASAEVLEVMVRRHRDKASPLAEAGARIGLGPHEMVTLASLIEKETGSAAERSLIAAVFHNRLRQGMPLQSDPTAVYEVPGARGRRIRRADLEQPSDYNTYRSRGLPPGPIANPGLAALEAAVRPAEVNHLYFVAREDGTHEFSRTLEEHNRAVARYQRRR